MIHQIKSGDTLSQLAQRFNTSVGALAEANGIQNPDLIYAGASLQIPGATDSFEGSAARRAGPDLTGAPGATGPSGGQGGDALSIARSVMGQNASSLKVSNSGIGQEMEDWVPNNVNCANFVSAVLEEAGQISDGQHHNAVTGLMSNLNADPNWSQTSLANARPGDVVHMKTSGGSGNHVVMFAGMENGQPTFIGSNNVNADGSQRITESSMNYPIAAIYTYRG